MRSSQVLVAIIVGWLLLGLVLVCGGCLSSGSRFDSPPGVTKPAKPGR